MFAAADYEAGWGGGVGGRSTVERNPVAGAGAIRDDPPGSDRVAMAAGSAVDGLDAHGASRAQPGRVQWEQSSAAEMIADAGGWAACDAS